MSSTVDLDFLARFAALAGALALAGFLFVWLADWLPSSARRRIAAVGLVIAIIAVAVFRDRIEPIPQEPWTDPLGLAGWGLKLLGSLLLVWLAGTAAAEIVYWLADVYVHGTWEHGDDMLSANRDQRER
jgi:hypothetical protein